MDWLLTSASTSAKHASQAPPLLFECVTSVPDRVTNRLSTFLEVLKQTRVELRIVLVKPIRLCRISSISREHWFEYCLCLEERFYFILELLILYILFYFFIGEQEFSNLKLVLSREAAA